MSVSLSQFVCFNFLDTTVYYTSSCNDTKKMLGFTKTSKTNSFVEHFSHTHDKQTVKLDNVGHVDLIRQQKKVVVKDFFRLFCSFLDN